MFICKNAAAGSLFLPPYHEFGYHTGDLGYLDAENRLFIEGRIRDIIVTENGEKINCNEVDERLYGLPGSREVAVFEVEGRMLAAVVPENDTVTQEQLEQEIGKYNATQPFARRVVQVWRREAANQQAR